MKPDRSADRNRMWPCVGSGWSHLAPLSKDTRSQGSHKQGNVDMFNPWLMYSNQSILLQICLSRRLELEWRRNISFASVLLSTWLWCQSLCVQRFPRINNLWVFSWNMKPLNYILQEMPFPYREKESRTMLSVLFCVWLLAMASIFSYSHKLSRFSCHSSGFTQGCLTPSH